MADETRQTGGLAPGTSRVTGRAHISEADITAFTRQYDPQPMHLDATAAQASVFGGLAASGWHVLSLTMRLVVETQPFGDTPLVGVEISNISFLKPTRPDTEIAARITHDETRNHSAGGQYGLVTVETMDAASGDLLVRQQWRMLLPYADCVARCALTRR